jgi:hypothetical protein
MGLKDMVCQRGKLKVQDTVFSLFFVSLEEILSNNNNQTKNVKSASQLVYASCVAVRSLA